MVDGLKTLLTANGGASVPNYLSQYESYTTALAFVQALARTQDSHGDTSSVRGFFMFVSVQSLLGPAGITRTLGKRCRGTAAHACSKC